MSGTENGANDLIAERAHLKWILEDPQLRASVRRICSNSEWDAENPEEVEESDFRCFLELERGRPRERAGRLDPEVRERRKGPERTGAATRDRPQSR